MAILDLPASHVRIIPTTVGGGFGSKLDLSVQPFVALAALRCGQPARLRYTRPESIRTTTKRHPSTITVAAGVDAHGGLVGVRLDAAFNTGAYASWGPTVANRVPVHGSGPYLVANYRARTRAIHTHRAPAGAFRGFGVPQAAIAQECVFDLLADRAGIDPLQFRIRHALRAGQHTVTGQVFERRRDRGVPRGAVDHIGSRPGLSSRGSGPLRHSRQGVAAIWYGCGNTALPQTRRRSCAGSPPTGATCCTRARWTSGRARTP